MNSSSVRTCRQALNDARGCAVVAGYEPNHHGRLQAHVKGKRALRELTCISEATAGVRCVVRVGVEYHNRESHCSTGPGAW